MSFLRVKTFQGRKYVFEVTTKRVEGKVVQTQKYLHKLTDKEKKRFEILNYINKVAPPEVKTKLRKKVSDGTLKDMETTTVLIGKLLGAPEKSEILLAERYTRKPSQNIHRLGRVAPEREMEDNRYKLGNPILNRLAVLGLELEKIDPSDLIESDREMIRWNIETILPKLEKFIRADSLIEGEVVESKQQLKNKGKD